MPTPIHLIRIFIGSPADLKFERGVVADEIMRWNARNPQSQLRLEPLRWETHATSRMGSQPQSVIDKQLAEDSDFLIAMFWSTLGGGGTRHEIEHFLRQKKRVALLFSNKRLDASIKLSELKAVRDFKESMKEEALFQTFVSEKTLRNEVGRIINTVAGELARDLPRLCETVVPASASTAHIRVISDSDHCAILTEKLADPSIKDVTVIAYTNEVRFHSLIDPYGRSQPVRVDIYKRSLVTDLADEQQTNLRRLALAGCPRPWEKLKVSHNATTSLNDEMAHRKPSLRVDQFFFDQPPPTRAYIFGDFESAIISYYGVRDDHDSEGGSVYKGMKGEPNLFVTNESEVGRILLSALREQVKALRRVSRTWTEECEALKGHFDGRIPAWLRPSLGPRAVLLDLDGVLVNSLPRYVKAWRNAFQAFKMDISRRDVYLEEGRKGRETIQRVARAYDRCLSEKEINAIHQLRNEWLRKYGRPMRLRGAEKLLNAIKAAGLKVRIVTGSSKPGIKSEIASTFPRHISPNDVIDGTDVASGKPDPEPFRKACLDLGVRPVEALVIENAPLGIEAAHRSGCFCIAVNTGPLSEDDLMAAGANAVFSGKGKLSACERLAAAWPDVLRILGKYKVVSGSMT